ncbi:MAG: hypothetical protein M1450_03160 [Patescibacteria group bacterium]|nr:hypothetical protein [Patescibacteria group bacterium]
MFNLQQSSIFKSSQMVVFGDGHSLIKEQNFSGDYFVSLPKKLAAILPGSVFLPGEFLKGIGFGVEKEYGVKRLIGQMIGNIEHLAFSFQERNFLMRVFHGSTNSHAFNLTKLAAIKDGFTTEKIRADYQKEQYLIIKPILNLASNNDFRIIEDCIASGDTIIGVLTLLTRQRKIPKRSKIRIDVVVSTTQGIMIIKEFCRENNLSLEINAGYLAFGLSKGKRISQSLVRIGANYLTYPKEFLELLPEKTALELKELKSADGNIYVVGDMGDAAKRLGKKWNHRCLWNSLRADQHGLTN